MEQTIVNVTDKAREQILRIKDEQNTVGDTGVRLAVVGGGCSGLSYKIDFTEPKERDNIMDLNGVKIYVDPKSSIYLKGVTLDFRDGLNGKGFVFENPNAKNTCGCGESFTV